MTDFIDEVLDESFGRSSKKWALLVVALLAGAGVAFWLTRRARGRSAPLTENTGDTELAGRTA